MKTRQGFVSNSSSSSFICISPNKGDAIYGDNEEECSFETEHLTFDIDKLINDLERAKKQGATTLNIEYGGGYDG